MQTLFWSGIVLKGQFCKQYMPNLKYFVAHWKHSELFSPKHFEHCGSQLLQDLEEISEEEMQLAKNYLMGRLLQRIDGPFNLASTFKDYYVESTPMDKFFTISRGIKETDAVTLKSLAQQLLQQIFHLSVDYGC